MSEEKRDILDELLSGVQEPTGDDDNATNDDASDTTTETTTKTEEKAPDYDAWRKERDGLLTGIREERKKRQEFQSRLDTLTGTVNAILDKRAKGAADPTGEPKKKPFITLDTDEEGNDVLPVDKLEVVLSPYKQEIEELRRLIATQHHVTQNQSEQQQQVQSILGEDEAFPKAYNKYTKAREWANARVIEWQKDNNYAGIMNGETAMDLVFNNELETEFQKTFPGADLESVVGNTKRSFRKALKSLAGTTPDEKPTNDSKKPDSRFQKVLQKPSGLAGSRNVKGGDGSVLDRLSSLSASDILNLSDKEAAAVQEAMLHEEKSGGVKF